MALNLNTIEGTLRPIGNRVLVTNMYFGEQRTRSGLIINSDDGTTRGIYPRWGQVHAKGPDNDDNYNVGDWVLVEHGRWTRTIEVEDATGITEVRMIDAAAIMMTSVDLPSDVMRNRV